MDEDGNPRAGVSIRWRSSNAAIVGVDPTGLATAVAERTASVLAEADDVSGEATVTVDIPDCIEPTLVSLAPGGVLVTDPPTHTSCALSLPAGQAGDRYRVAIVRLSSAVSPIETPTAILTLTAQGMVASAAPQVLAPALPPLLGVREMTQLEESSRIARATEQVHLLLRAAEADLLRRFGPLSVQPPKLMAAAGPFPAAPAKQTFMARSPFETTCDAQPVVTGLLVAENGDIAVYQDSAHAQSQPLSPANATRMIDFYGQWGRSTDETYFGVTPDRDGNGQVVVLATPLVSGNVAAFVWGGDQLSRTGSQSCPASNEMELVCFNPSHINAMSSGNHQAIETLVHEAKHIISFHQRLSGTTFLTYPDWIEEGTAEIAGEVASRRAWAAAGGPPPNGVVTRQSFPAAGSPLTVENYGVYLRLFRTMQYLSTQPNSLVVSTVSTAYSIYGSGWHFHRFLGDAYGGAATAPGADAPLFSQQSQGSTPAGLAGLKAVTGKSYEELLVDYAAAIMLSGTGVPTQARTFTIYDFASATTVVQNKPQVPYPYPVTAAGPNPSASFASGSWSSPIGSGGIIIHDFVSNGTGSGAEITVQVEPPARVVVVRLH